MPQRTDAVWQEAIHLIAAYEALQRVFARSSSPTVQGYARSLAEGRHHHDAVLAAGQNGRWPAGFLAGLREGAREMPYLLAVVPESERAAAIEEVAAAGGMWLADLVRGTKRRAAAILKRGRIRSEDEYRCVRERVDQLEGEQPPSADLPRYYALLDSFGTPAR